MHSAPFSTVSHLHEWLILVLLDLPRPQGHILIKRHIRHVPCKIIVSTPSNPQPVYIHVEVYIKISLGCYRDVGCWNRLTQGGGWSDWRQEGDRKLKGSVVSRGRGYAVTKICCGRIVLGTDIIWIGKLVAYKPSGLIIYVGGKIMNWSASPSLVIFGIQGVLGSA